MAATVCHPRLQLHLESQLVESRTLTLRLPSPKQSNDLAFKSCFPDSNMNKTETFQDKPNNGGWNFVDALSNISQNISIKETTIGYVHPQQNRFSLGLNPKSLELCTENLGNESGTNIVENDMLLSLMETKEQRQSCRKVLAATKKVKIQNFPPPLTTIRGSESLRVRPHREDGRLVIEVTKVPPSTSCFQAERSHGRLRLCFGREEEQEEDSENDIDDDVMDENEQAHNEEEFFKNEMMGEETKDAEKEDQRKKMNC
ncbi:protein FANTASTIC FOUR 3-like [Vicia villosa]|uniref:protein FANTASTIC FOUR 3-like n=1 Tax=Vicia villosa TaxID=3911 RepID=UPI00273C0FCA|nr:protein FANTASTIC FOUR 3-like [Vicia villosa]